MKRLLTIVSIIIALSSFAHNENGLIFKENKNQWPAKVQFCSELSNGQIYIEKHGFTFQLFDVADIKNVHDSRLRNDPKLTDQKDPIIHGHVYKMEFEGGILSSPKKLVQQPEYYNYFLDNDPAHWASMVKAFGVVEYKSVYKGIDLKLYSSKGNFKYDLIIQPNAKIEQVKLKYDFTHGVELVNNKLLIRTSIGEIIENIPEAYQIINDKKVFVDCKYILVGKDKVSFKIEGKYDPSKELIIDPVVVASSYSGTQSVSYGLGVAPDAKGNMYLYSMNMTKHYPATFGAIQTSYYGGFYDNTLSKFNLTGTAKRFSTYIGGNKEETIINCIIQNDEVAIFGTTTSDTFPIIKNGFQSQLKGKTDYFLMKIDTTGSILKGSTYLGGERAEGFSTIGNASWYYSSLNTFGEMVLDKWNNCYIIGSSLSLDYPTTPGSYKEFSDSNGYSDVVITKINSDLSTIKWSTFYGGSANNSPAGLRLSKAGTIYGAGTTNSKNFPTTPGVVHSTSVTTLDMFAFNLDTLNGFPISSTYIGAKITEALRLDLDLNDNVYIVGNSMSPSSTTITSGAFNINTGSVFFYKLDPGLAAINVIARFGYPITGPVKIEIDAFNVDSCGYIYFGGFGHPGLPVTPNAFKAVSSAKGNMYLGMFNPNFTSLKFASYYGGDTPRFEDHDDGGLNYFDDRGYFYHAVCVEKDWPLTGNAYSSFNVTDSMVWSNSIAKNSDAFVKIDLQTFVNANSSLGGLLKSCSPITATFSTNPNLGSVTIDPGDGSPSVNTNSLIHSYNSFGTYTALVIAGADSSTCNIIDSIKILVKYGAAPIPNLDDQSINCAGSDLFLDAGNPGSVYKWSTGETDQVIKPAKSGMYKVKVENEYCYIRDSSQVTIEEGHDYSMPNAFTPNGDGDNDAFCLKGWKHCNQTFKIMIFDRWGEKVFESEDPNFCWNGYYNEKLLSADVYIYHLTATFVGDKQINRKGNITLIR